jgi:hypothetical protein
MARSRQYAMGDVLLCAACAPNNLEPEAHPAETDLPPHCRWCGAPLSALLTRSGVNYVVSQLVEWLRNPRWWFEPPPASLPQWLRRRSHYESQPPWAVARDWALDLREYSLEPAHEYVVDLFLANASAMESCGPASTLPAPSPAPQRRRLPRVVEDAHGDA